MTTRILMKHKLVVLCLAVFALSAVASELKYVQAQDGPTETVDLLSWRDRNGRTLFEANKGYSLALVAIVSPSCSTCATSKDAMQSLRDRAKKAGMAYYVLMIPDSTDTAKYFSYADSLKIDAEAFVWSNAEAKAPASLATMPAPSHILLTSEGIVVNKWAGVPENVDKE